MATAAQPHPIELDVDSATTLLATRGLTIRGRDFTVVTHPTFRQAAYLEKWRRAAKIDEMMQGFDPANDEKVSSFVADLIVQSFESDAIFHVLAGGLVEVKGGRPQKWTRDGADALAEWIAELEDAADQEALQRAILGVIASFFLSRIVALVASPSSSEDSATTEEPETIDRAEANDPPRPSSVATSNNPPAPDGAREAEPPDAGPDLWDRILASASKHSSTSRSASEPESASDSASSAI